MKWFPRICSILLTLVWMLMAWLTVVVPEDRTTPVGWALLALALVACAGLLFAWRKPRAGGAIAVVAGLAYALVNLAANAAQPPLPLIGLLTAGPFVLTGLLFAATSYWQPSLRTRSGALAVLVTVVVTALALGMFVLGLGTGVGRVMVD